ncbi:MAG: PKD domain-containing protein, partial [Bacteroidota bacterium]
MKKSIFYTLLMLCCCWWMPQAQAQFGNFNISGQVTFAEEEIPVPEYPVHLIIPALDIQETTMTDDAGNYSLDVEIDPVFLADVEVYVIDFCIGDVITVQTTNESDSTIIDFNVCSIINPPHTGPTCDAFFQADIIDPAALTVQFIDLSFSSLPINTWAWDFGDGNSSVESSPLHTYAEIGEYEVSLTIESDSCASTVTHIVAVDTIIGGGCNCEAIFDPVCVDLFGIPIQFPNECEALCAGADPSFFVD